MHSDNGAFLEDNNDASYNDSTLDSVKEGIQFGDSPSHIK